MGDVKEKGDRKAFLKALDSKDTIGERRFKELGTKIRETEKFDQEAWARHRLEQDLDNKAIDRLQIRHGQWIPPERVADARKEAATFQEKSDFEAELAEREPGKTKEEIERTAGYMDGDDVRVKRNIETPGTLVHERLHTLSHPEAKKALGGHLYEGMTEDLALRETDFNTKLHSWERRTDGTYEIKPPPEYYPENRETLNLIQARVPESALMEAYFQGNDKRLEAFIDHDCGDGTWKETKKLLEEAEKNGDRKALEKARKLLKRG